MGRPLKPGIDYFPLDVVLDVKFQLIEAEFGLEGFALVVKLLQRIYGEQGYYCEWTDEVALLFASRYGKSVNVVSELIKCCIRRGLFDDEMLKRHKILTSRGIQKRYLEAKRGDISKIKNEYLLLNSPITDINATKTGVFATKTAVNVVESTQSKVKESKVKESKRERVCSSPSLPTLDDIKKFAKERNSNVDPERFFDYYQSQNWKCGNTPITDWKTKFMSWEKSERPKQAAKGNTKPTGFVNYNQPVYSDEEIDAAIKRKKQRG